MKSLQEEVRKVTKTSTPPWGRMLPTTTSRRCWVLVGMTAQRRMQAQQAWSRRSGWPTTNSRSDVKRTDVRFRQQTKWVHAGLSSM